MIIVQTIDGRNWRTSLASLKIVGDCIRVGVPFQGWQDMEDEPVFINPQQVVIWWEIDDE